MGSSRCAMCISEEYAPVLSYLDKVRNGIAKSSDAKMYADTMGISIPEFKGMVHNAQRLIEAADRMISRTVFNTTVDPETQKPTTSIDYSSVGRILCPYLYARGKRFGKTLQKDPKTGKEVLVSTIKWIPSHYCSGLLDASGIATGGTSIRSPLGTWDPENPETYFPGKTCVHFQGYKIFSNPNASKEDIGSAASGDTYSGKGYKTERGFVPVETTKETTGEVETEMQPEVAYKAPKVDTVDFTPRLDQEELYKTPLGDSKKRNWGGGFGSGNKAIFGDAFNIFLICNATENDEYSDSALQEEALDPIESRRWNYGDNFNSSTIADHLEEVVATIDESRADMSADKSPQDNINNIIDQILSNQPDNVFCKREDNNTTQVQKTIASIIYLMRNGFTFDNLYRVVQSGGKIDLDRADIASTRLQQKATDLKQKKQAPPTDIGHYDTVKRGMLRRVRVGQFRPPERPKAFGFDIPDKSGTTGTGFIANIQSQIDKYDQAHKSKEKMSETDKVTLFNDAAMEQFAIYLNGLANSNEVTKADIERVTPLRNEAFRRYLGRGISRSTPPSPELSDKQSLEWIFDEDALKRGKFVKKQNVRYMDPVKKTSKGIDAQNLTRMTLQQAKDNKEIPSDRIITIPENQPDDMIFILDKDNMPDEKTIELLRNTLRQELEDRENRVEYEISDQDLLKHLAYYDIEGSPYTQKRIEYIAKKFLKEGPELFKNIFADYVRQYGKPSKALGMPIFPIKKRNGEPCKTENEVLDRIWEQAWDQFLRDFPIPGCPWEGKDGKIHYPPSMKEWLATVNDEVAAKRLHIDDPVYTEKDRKPVTKQILSTINNIRDDEDVVEYYADFAEENNLDHFSVPTLNSYETSLDPRDKSIIDGYREEAAKNKEMGEIVATRYKDEMSRRVLPIIEKKVSQMVASDIATTGSKVGADQQVDIVHDAWIKVMTYLERIPKTIAEKREITRTLKTPKERREALAPYQGAFEGLCELEGWVKTLTEHTYIDAMKETRKTDQTEQIATPGGGVVSTEEISYKTRGDFDTNIGKQQFNDKEVFEKINVEIAARPNTADIFLNTEMNDKDTLAVITAHPFFNLKDENGVKGYYRFENTEGGVQAYKLNASMTEWDKLSGEQTLPLLSKVQEQIEGADSDFGVSIQRLMSSTQDILDTIPDQGGWDNYRDDLFDASNPVIPLQIGQLCDVRIPQGMMPDPDDPNKRNPAAIRLDGVPILDINTDAHTVDVELPMAEGNKSLTCPRCFTNYTTYDSKEMNSNDPMANYPLYPRSGYCNAKICPVHGDPENPRTYPMSPKEEAPVQEQPPVAPSNTTDMAKQLMEEDTQSMSQAPAISSQNNSELRLKQEQWARSSVRAVNTNQARLTKTEDPNIYMCPLCKQEGRRIIQDENGDAVQIPASGDAGVVPATLAWDCGGKIQKATTTNKGSKGYNIKNDALTQEYFKGDAAASGVATISMSYIFPQLVADWYNTKTKRYEKGIVGEGDFKSISQVTGTLGPNMAPNANEIRKDWEFSKQRQLGIPYAGEGKRWDPNMEYKRGDVVNNGKPGADKKTYKSSQDNNIGHDLEDGQWWFRFVNPDNSAFKLPPVKVYDKVEARFRIRDSHMDHLYEVYRRKLTDLKDVKTGNNLRRAKQIYRNKIAPMYKREDWDNLLEVQNVWKLVLDNPGEPSRILSFIDSNGTEAVPTGMDTSKLTSLTNRPKVEKSVSKPKPAPKVEPEQKKETADEWRMRYDNATPEEKQRMVEEMLGR